MYGRVNSTFKILESRDERAHAYTRARGFYVSLVNDPMPFYIDPINAP